MLLAPVAAVSAPVVRLRLGSLAATVFLGAASTALAFVWFATLVGRVGSTRGSITVYLLPVVAIALGATAARRADLPGLAAGDGARAGRGVPDEP